MDRPTCIFLPGIIAPAVVRYAPLLGELGSAVDARTKELELYTLSPPPSTYSISYEVDGLARCADDAGLKRFHLYGHSGGGAVALAFTAAHPERVLSLALDEAAFDFSEEMAADIDAHLELVSLLKTEPTEALPRFLRMELRTGADVSLPPPPGPPLPNRPLGIATLLEAFTRHRIDTDAFRRFERPVLYTRGSLSAERYERSAARLAGLFPRFREEVFEGLFHLHTSHQAEPARVAALLADLWAGS